jgi:hypothetical protein
MIRVPDWSGWSQWRCDRADQSSLMASPAAELCRSGSVGLVPFDLSPSAISSSAVISFPADIAVPSTIPSPKE